MTKYTCISCRVAFSNPDIQRSHYKTDWHRYNLKRKVIELPPITAEEFQSRVLFQRTKEEEESKNSAVFCKVCRKSFVTEKAFSNHLNSKKHKYSLSTHNQSSDVILDNKDIVGQVHTNVKKETVSKDSRLPVLKKEEPTEEDDDSEWEDIDDDESYIDDEQSNSESDELDEISENNPILCNNCLFCNNHSASMTKNINHMSVEHSFFIPDLEYVVDLRGLLLYLGEKVCRFYLCLWCNLSGRSLQSLEAAQTHMRDKGHCKILHEGETLIEYSPYYNYYKSYPDFEDTMDIDEEFDLEQLDGSDFQLKLPSGATVGHRSLSLYYKQYFGPNQDLCTYKKSKVSKLMSTYRALGWKENDKDSISRKVRDIQFFNRVQAKYFQKLGVKANKLQKHFRPQVNF